MEDGNEDVALLRRGLKLREFTAVLAGFTAGQMVPGLSHGEERNAAAPPLPRRPAGKLLPMRKSEIASMLVLHNSVY